MECCNRHDLVLAHDNPYVDLALEGEAPALLRCPQWKERGIEFFSLSKGWCLGGFRLAFAVGAEPLISALRQLKGVVDFNQCRALQQGAVLALDRFAHWPGSLRPIYRDRRDRMLRSLERMGWFMPEPSMALYLWMPLPSWARARGWSDEQLADPDSEPLERDGCDSPWCALLANSSLLWIALHPGGCFNADVSCRQGGSVHPQGFAL